jgi:hypothetical protein
MVGQPFEADRSPTLARQRSVSRQRFAPGVYRVGTLGREDAALRESQTPGAAPAGHDARRMGQSESACVGEGNAIPQ